MLQLSVWAIPTPANTATLNITPHNLMCRSSVLLLLVKSLDPLPVRQVCTRRNQRAGEPICIARARTLHARRSLAHSRDGSHLDKDSLAVEHAHRNKTNRGEIGRASCR